MRSSLSGTHLRVSSSVDQIDVLDAGVLGGLGHGCAPAAISFSGEKCSQKNVTQKAP